MTEEEFRKIIKEEIRPVKELAELTKKKVDQIEFHTDVSTGTVRTVKEQQSIMNEKLDNLSEKSDAHSASLMQIESSIKVYDEIYQDNKRDIKKLKKRTSKIESTLGLPLPD